MQIKFRMGALTAGLIGICAALQAQAESPTYMMSVYGNRPAGDQLASGDYKAAYIKLADPVAIATDSLSWQTNLCVAATLSRVFDSAARACDVAVQLATSERQMTPAWSKQSRQAGSIALAIAYWNRGILRSVSGRQSLAQRDFKAARKIAPNEQFALQNVEALQTQRLASAQ